MFLKIFVVVAMLLVSTGCLRKVEVVKRERLDQELSGNRGVLHGPVPTTPSMTPTTREYVEWDIEVPTYEVAVKVPEWRREWHDKELWGNRGYMTGGPAQKRPQKEATSVPKAEKPSSSFFRRPAPAPQAEEVVTAPSPSYSTYTVKKGDTLGDISSKVYGTSKLWKQIYDANTDVLKDPNRLKPGQVLRVPPAEKKMKATSSGTVK